MSSEVSIIITTLTIVLIIIVAMYFIGLANFHPLHPPRPPRYESFDATSSTPQQYLPHGWTDAELAQINAGQSQQSVCQNGGNIFTGGNNANYPGCSTAWCCTPAQTGLTPAPVPVSGLSEYATRLISLINQSPNCQSLNNLKTQFVNNPNLSSLDMYNVVNAYQAKYVALSCANPSPSPQPAPQPSPLPVPLTPAVPSGNTTPSSLYPASLDGVFVAKYVGPVPAQQ